MNYEVPGNMVSWRARYPLSSVPIKPVLTNSPETLFDHLLAPEEVACIYPSIFGLHGQPALRGDLDLLYRTGK